VLAALIDGCEVPFGDGGDSARCSGTGSAYVTELNLVAERGRDEDAEDIDLNRGGVVLLLDRECAGSAGDGWKSDGIGICMCRRHGFEDEEIVFRRENNGGDATVGGKEGSLAEGLARCEIGDRREGSKGIADAQKEGSVAKTPEVLAVIVKTPLGSGEDVAGGDFNQNCVNEAILIVGRLVGQALEEAMGAPGEKQMPVVHVMEGVHGAAGEKELRRGLLEAKWFQRDAKCGVGIASGQEGYCDEKERKEAD
jgi:hypothetical protein